MRFLTILLIALGIGIIGLTIGVWIGDSSNKPSIINILGEGVSYSEGISSNQLIYQNITLVDHTVYNQEENTCLASNLGMKIFVEDCHTKPLASNNIEQIVYFNWTGNNPQDTSWVFVYEGTLESGSMKWFDESATHNENVFVQVEQYINNHLIDNIVGYTNLGIPQYGTCQIGTENNSMMYEVNRQNQNGTYATIYCFSSQTPVNSTALRISGNATINTTQQIQVPGAWKPVDVTYMGYDLLGNNFSYYKVSNKTFEPGESVKTLWRYTPNNMQTRGKWHIVGYAGQDTTDLYNSINTGNYIYMDPSWESYLNNGLTAWYKFNESAGASALESVFGVENGTINGATLGTSGIIGTAYSFNGAGNNVQIGDNPFFDGLTDFSISAWINPSDLVSIQLIVGDDSGAVSGRMEVGLSGNDMWIRLQGEGTATASSNTTITNTSTWQHLVFVRDAGDRYFYYNGNRVDYQTGKLATAMGNPQTTFIGSRDGAGTYAYAGGLDEIGFFNRTLNDTEVLQLYNGGLGISYEIIIPDMVTVELLTPSEYFTTFETNTLFSANVSTTSATATMSNATLFIYNSSSEIIYSNTTTLPALSSANANWTYNLSIGSYNWSVYAEDTTGIGNISNNRTITITDFIENNISYKTNSYDTEQNSYIINLTIKEGITNSLAVFIYHGTEYTSEKSVSGDNILFNTTIDIPTVSNDNSNKDFYWNLELDGLSYNTTSSSQVVNQTVFVLCNSTYNNVFMNLSFKDESNLSIISASIPTSTFNYYFGSGSVNKSYYFTNNTVNNQYLFCTKSNDTLYIDPLVQYESTPAYPARIWNIDSEIYSAITHKVLYLLNTLDVGQYVTFQVTNVGDQPISSVEATVTKVIESETVDIGSGYTDAAGLIEFWLDPDSIYTYSFTKDGYDTYTASFAPTQTEYTITLSGGTSESYDYFQGVGRYLAPRTTELYNDTLYNFILNLTSSYWDVDSFGFNLRLANGTIVTSQESTTEGTPATYLYNVNNQSVMYMDYYWVINGTYTNATKRWIVFNTANTQWSIKNFFDDFNSYSSAGIFGLDDFGKNLIVFVIIFFSIGIVSYKYGLQSPLVIAIIMFGIVYFFDVTVDLIPVINGIPNVPTLIMGLIVAIMALKEVITR